MIQGVSPQLKAIAAMAQNRTIGRDGSIPWHLPEDFRWFKKTTLGHAVLMGRKTFESLGRPLPGRRNIVLTRGAALPDVETLSTIDALDLSKFDTDIFVIGGAEVYRQLIPYCSVVYLTRLFRAVDGDTRLPEFEAKFGKPELLETHVEFEILRYPREPIPPLAH